MSLSDNKPSQKPGGISDWKPLDLGAGANSGARRAGSPQGFQVLYESEPETVGEEFVPLIQQESQAPAPSALETAEPASPGALPQPDLEAVKREAFDKGYADGLAEGREAGRREADGAIERLDGIVREIESLWSRLVEVHEEKIMLLVTRVAEKVIMGQVVVDREPVKQAILKAFASIPEPVAVTIRINPEDYEYVESLRSEFFKQVSDLKEIAIIADPALGRGGCKLETQSGEIDASIEARLEAVRRSLLEAYGQKTPDA